MNKKTKNNSRVKKLFKKIILFNNATKVQRLIYLLMIVWVFFGIMGIKYESNLTYIAGYYASLSIFIGSYIWGEYKRKSNTSKLFEGGPNSTREITIYLTLLLWFCLGMYGILNHADFSKLTVYFTALAPFVDSYIIYQTTKKDTKNPIDNEKIKDFVKEIEEKGKNE